MKSNKVALSGSYSGDTFDLFKKLPQDGLLQFSVVGREVTLQVKIDRLEDVVKSLGSLGVSNLSIIEWKKSGATAASAGTGKDSKETVTVQVIPTTLGEGLKLLSIASRKEGMDRKAYIEVLANLELLLSETGITDVLYSLQFEKEASKGEYVQAVKEATLNAIYNCGGISALE